MIWELMIIQKKHLLLPKKPLQMVSEQVNIGMESVVYLEEYEKSKKNNFK